MGHQPAALDQRAASGRPASGQAAAQGQGVQGQGVQGSQDRAGPGRAACRALQGQGVQGQEQGQALEADVQAHLGRQLRAVYDEMASQPVPDRFIELLDALERKSQRKPESRGRRACYEGG